MSRDYISKVSRDFQAIENLDKEPSWFKDFEDNLKKDAVKSKKEDYSLYDQINNIVGNKSSFSSVEEKVLDMQKRTGLYDLINNTKIAQLSEGTKSDIFEACPELKTFIENYIQDRPGTSVEAVIHDILKINKIKEQLPEGDDVPEEVKRYISDMLANSQKENLHHSSSDDINIGKADYSDDGSLDDDPFSGCQPNVQG